MRWDEDERGYERESVEQDGESGNKTVEPRREESRKRNSGKGKCSRIYMYSNPKKK